MTAARTEIMLRNALKSPTPPRFETEDLKFTKEFRDLMNKILIRDHRQRITSSKLLKSEWFHIHGISSLHDAVRIVRDYILSGDNLAINNSNSSSSGSLSNKNNKKGKGKRKCICPVNPMYILSCSETPRNVQQRSESHFLMVDSPSLNMTS